jgi:hypothetical protein
VSDSAKTAAWGEDESDHPTPPPFPPIYIGQARLPGWPEPRFRPPPPPYVRVFLEPADLAAIRARIARGEVRVREWARLGRPADPGDPILRNEHGRAVLSASGYCVWPDYLDAGCVEDIFNASWVVGRSKYFHEGPPPPDLLVECECACDCRWVGRLDEARWDLDEGLIQCRACVSQVHPPVLRQSSGPGGPKD